MKTKWYTGIRAKKAIKEKLKLIDVIFVVVDARLPLSSQSSFLNNLNINKPLLLILNKIDLADQDMTEHWLKWFSGQGMRVVPCTLVKDAGTKEVFKAVSRLVNEEQAGVRRRRVVRCIVLGIPNVGKSMFINRLAGKKVARTGEFPGLTKGEQWIRIGNLELLDTPGVLEPCLENKEVMVKLAATGAIRQGLYDAEQVAIWLLEWLAANKKGELAGRYGLDEKIFEMHFLPPVSWLSLIGQKRGFLNAQGKVDLYRTSLHILKDFRAGKLGKCTLDQAPSKDIKRT